MSYRQGDIVQVNLGEPPHEVQGHEQGYSRPCIVIRSLPALQLAIIAPRTSKTPTYSYYTIVKLSKGAAGLPMDSYVLCHQVRTVSFSRLKNTIGTLENRDLLKIKAVLLDTLD